MLRILRAFAWLRWRILLNSLERGGGRDAVERFSVAIEQLGPMIAALVMIPSAIALAGAAAYSGWALAQGHSGAGMFKFLRFLLFAGCVLSAVGPLILPASERTNAVRLLLLPIPRGMLFLGQAMSTLADPWIALIAVVVLVLPFGMAAGGAAGAAAVALMTGLLLIAALTGISLVVTTAVHLIVRNRRRGELLALVFILILPMLGMMPGLIDSNRRQRPRGPRPEVAASPKSAWRANVERVALSAVPSEMYTTTVGAAARSNFAASGPPLAALAATVVLLHGFAFAVFVRILNAPGTIGASRSASRSPASRWRLPGVSPGTSAVALNQFRLALRTPRGRSTLLSPIVLFVMFAVVMMRSDSGRMEFGLIRLQSGIGLAGFASFVALLSILPLAMNQFAIDRAGLTLALLTPLETRELLRGKAIGNAAIAGIPAAICILGALILFPAGNPALWLSVPLTLVATYLLVAPLAAVLSAIFPRAVDLNSIGRGSNAHGAAGLLGTLTFVVSGAPCLLIVLLATELLGRPLLAPILLTVWVVICAGLSFAIFSAAAALFDRRRENLGLVV
jgi:hypothetical protein